MDNMVGIYKIVAPSGSTYVGMTLESFANRHKGHLKKLRQNSHHCKGLHRAFLKYGEQSLVFSILHAAEKGTLTVDEAHALEQQWWDTLQSSGVKLYNGRPSGRGSVFHTEESKSKISKRAEEKFLAKYNLTEDDIMRDERGRLKFKKICLNVDCGSEYFGSVRDKYCARQCSLSDPNRKFGTSKAPRIEMKATIQTLKDTGKTLDEISEELSLTVKTVRRYVNS